MSSYIYDVDLEFLKNCSNEDLGVLVEYLTKDKDGTLRITEELTLSDDYKRYYPNHKMYWKSIAKEIQTFGGNTFMNFLRGNGVLYKEVLCDVCDKMKVNYNQNDSTENIEQSFLIKILEDSIDKLSSEDIKNLVNDLGIKGTNLSKQALMTMIQGIIKQGGFKSYQILVTVANTVAKNILGHGLRLTTNAALTKGLSVLVGPIGWTITGLWTLIDIAGPAYRVTIPVCVQVAYMRSIAQNKNSNSNNISVADEIEKLYKLYKQGIITKEEFEKEKTRLLNR